MTKQLTKQAHQPVSTYACPQTSHTMADTTMHFVF